MSIPGKSANFVSALLAAVFALFAVSALAAEKTAPSTGADRPTVVLIPLEGFIDKGLYDSVKRRTAEAEALDPAMIVFRIDTYGGLVDAAIEITDEIGGIEAPKTVAFVPTKAFSAGAMIAMGAREIVLTPNSSIGDAAPVATGPEGPKILGEKMQSPVRNMFRKYAQRNGYPDALVEAMVSPDIEVLEITYKDGTKKYITSGAFDDLTEAEKANVDKKRVVVREGEILTATATEALDYGIARFVVKDLDELLAKYSLSGARIVTLDVNWSEELVRRLNHPIVASLILLVGIMGIYMEFKIPGFGLPGTVGVICFAVFFFSKHLSGMAQNWEILLFIVGLVLLGIEIFLIPGFGITGFLGATFVVVALVMALVPSHITPAPLDVDFLAKSGAQLVATLIAAFSLAVLLAKVLPKVPVVGKFYLGAPEQARVPHSEGAGLTEDKGNLVGKVGRAQTLLRPAGRAIIDGELLDVTTRGDVIAKDTLVEVIDTKGNNIIVKKAT
ncbi:MAG: hypothetical protein J7M19_02285 [Planctomycetes bacterium]|nr:hypothetical protein [Planctomycetota bacterium]